MSNPVTALIISCFFFKSNNHVETMLLQAQTLFGGIMEAQRSKGFKFTFPFSEESIHFTMWEHHAKITIITSIHTRTTR